MAWTTPRTWADGEVPTASIMNTHWRDNLNHVYGSAVSTFTPTLTQTTSVTVTTGVGRYVHVGDVCWLHVFIDVGGSGTISGTIVVGAIPSAIAPRSSSAFSSTGDVETGQGWLFDSGAVQPLYRMFVRFSSSSELQFFDMQATTNTAFGPGGFQITSADSLAFNIVYSTSTPSA